MINWFNHLYPYSNLHELNLDWVIATVKNGEKEIADFIGVNTIKYANPILWNIESQYEANTVVVDGQTGNAYISVKAVPSGVHLNRTEYWTQIYNYANVVDTLRAQIAHNEGDTTTATQPFVAGDLVFISGLLYRVIAPMIAGDSFVENSNIVKTTIEDELKANIQAIQSEASARQSADTQLQSNIDAEISARQSADTQLQSNIDVEASARQSADTQLQSNIDAEVSARQSADTQLQTTLQASIDALENVVDNLDINHVYTQSTPNSGLTTNIGLKEGTYNIDENTTINAQLVIPKGAIINISEGITLTINGEILAGRYQIFSGDGDVVVDSKSQPVGYPEWFGAIANDSTDCTTAIQKCINVFKETSLTNGTYKITSTLKVTSGYKTISGYGIWRGATVVKMYSTSSTILQLGPDTQPAQINSFLQDIRVSNVEFTRNTNNWANGSKGIDCRWILRSNLVDVMSSESSTPFYIQGCVYTKFIRCTAFSTTLSSGDTTREYAGFRLTANTSIGSAGGNASIYILNCSSTTGGVIYDSSWSLQAYGTYGVADLYIDELESNGVSYGIVIQGTNGRNTSHDIIITNCIIDAIKKCGIQIINCAFGTVTVSNNYIAIGANTSTSQGIHAKACVNCTFSNNQIIGSVASADVHGIYIDNSIACNFIGNMIYECELSHYLDNNSINCLLEDSVFNEATTTTYVVSIQSGGNHNIKCNIKAKSTYLVRLNNGVTGCSIDATLLNRDDVTNEIITIAGSSPTQNGYFNSNYVTGYFKEPT